MSNTQEIVERARQLRELAGRAGEWGAADQITAAAALREFADGLGQASLTPQPALAAEVAGYQCRIQHDGGWGEWASCTRELFAHIRATGRYFGPASAVAEAREVFTRPPLIIRAAESGYAVVPARLGITPEALVGLAQASMLVVDEWLPTTLWIGEVATDDGKKIYGLHAFCDDYPDEGCVTLAEFSPIPEVPA